MTTCCHKPRKGYTLLEILLAIGLVAILLGISVPLISGSFGASDSEQATEAMAATASAARASALENGEAKRVAVMERGLESEVEGIPVAKLPDGWKLQVRRLTDQKFRRPAKSEVWEFNGAGICEPLSFLLSDGFETVTLTFDPLTAQIIGDE